MRKWFTFRFLYGTSGWNAAVLLLLLVCYALLALLLSHAHLGSIANGALLGGFVLLLLIGVLLFYGARQATMSRRLDAETLRADAEHELTLRLQEALVQQPLPAISNLGFSAIYLPAARQALVGGDWYDAFQLRRERVMFSIGDVAGHGIEAAATMSHARQSIIAAALQDSDPGSILARANESLIMRDSVFATAICGFIDPETLQVIYATAGHPPGILVDKSGMARPLQYEGLPLGVNHGTLYPTFKLTAEYDSILILYTDGLLEYDHNLIEGERRMFEVAKDIAIQRPADPAGAIADAVFHKSRPLDDVAILAIAFRGDPIDRPAEASERAPIEVRELRGLSSRRPLQTVGVLADPRPLAKSRSFRTITVTWTDNSHRPNVVVGRRGCNLSCHM